MPAKRRSSKRKSVTRRESTKSKSTTTTTTSTTTSTTTTRAAALTGQSSKLTLVGNGSEVEEIKVQQQTFSKLSSHLIDVRPPKRIRSEDNKVYYDKFKKEAAPLRKEKSLPSNMDVIFSSFQSFSLESFDPSFDAIFNKKSTKKELETQSSNDSSHESASVKKEISHYSESSTDQTKRYTTSDSSHTDVSGHSSSSKSYDCLDLSKEYQYPRRTSLDNISVASELSTVIVPEEFLALAAGSFSVALGNDSSTAAVGSNDVDSFNTLNEELSVSDVATTTTTTITMNNPPHDNQTADTTTTVERSVTKKATHTMTLRKRK